MTFLRTAFAIGAGKEFLVKRFVLPAVYASLTIITEWSVFGRGMPMLRHDWRFPDTGAALGPVAASFFSGWLTGGIGSPQPYPTFYYWGFALWALHPLLSPLVAVMLIVAAGVLLAAASSAAIARNAGAGILGATALALFAVLNPWVFSKIVAGHIFMVFAYAVILALVAEIMRPNPRTPALIALAALCVTQLEYCVILFVPLALWLVRTRRYAPLTVLLLSALPIAVGIAASFHTLAETPYNLEWQRAESVPLLSGLTLTGYQFGYAHAFAPWRWPIGIFVCAAAFGARFIRRKGLDGVVVLVALLSLIVASGTTGPIAPAYSYAVTHITASGLFRELYDLLAFAAVAYVLLAARQLAASPLWKPVLCIAAASLAIPWLLHPASQWFVSGSTLPRAPRPAYPLRRVAYFPAFQPLSYNGKGSGVDPDAYAISGTSDPMNEATPAYPVDVALANAENGETADLGALGVSEIISRTGYSSQWNSLGPQFSFAVTPATGKKVPAHLHALPLLALYDSPPSKTSIGDGLTEISIAAPMQQATVLRPTRATLDPRKDWIDARSAFVARPNWGNPWGGVATSSSKALYLPPGTRAVLADVVGKLYDDRGRAVTEKRPGMHWWSIVGNAVRCQGACLVVAAAREKSRLPEHAAPPMFEALRPTAITPWLLYADIPPGNRMTTLRYAVRFDTHWAALDGSRILPHVALDGIFNGWVLPRSNDPKRVIFIEWLAALQLLLEMVAALTTLALLCACALRSNALQFFRNNQRVDLNGAGSGSQTPRQS